ncbi:MAG: histone H1 [Gemmatimonadaceae bacterium]|nr:histone H1 [Gemmatimonadaceae bacterium]MBA3557211.1 histone H1 [Gemmatimonadaceae bacterium]
MPKKPAKLRPDVAETAFRVMQEATGQVPKSLPPSERAEKNPDAVERGQKGGKKGGKARAGKLSSGDRSAIAKKAAATRWGQRTKPTEGA